MSENVDLLMDFCSYDAALYAVEHWHYSNSLPPGKTFKVGVWENKKFIGAIVYAYGACCYVGHEFSLRQDQWVELTRVALNKHKTEVTKLVSISLKILKKECPGLRLVVSYADQNQDHLGVIYQAGNWIYVGETKRTRNILINGELKHTRTVSSSYGNKRMDYLRKHVDKNAKAVYSKPKYKYLMPLDKKMRKKILRLKKDYPK